MGSALLPKGIIQMLNKIQCNFWWGAEDNHHRTHFCKWEQLKLHKKVWGLGFRDPLCYNRVATMKVVWKFISDHQSLWGRLLKAKYLKGLDFWTVAKPARCSHIWHAILSVRREIKEGSLMLIQDGRTTGIWEALGSGTGLVP